MSIQLYGQFGDYMSIPNVSRAVAAELHRKHLKFTVWGTGAIAPTYVDTTPWPIIMNPNAPIGIYVGYPGAAPGWLKGHATKILITVCETNKIPSEWVTACMGMDYIFVPSKFCRQVFIDSGVRKPVMILPHGADRYTNRLDWQHDDTIDFLHVTGAVSFPHRKGTPALLKAWKSIEEKYPKARLTLKMFDEPRIMRYIEQLQLKNYFVDSSPSLAPPQMAAYLSTFDAVIQPSRGEGFGIVPLEARIHGVPVIITSIAGHSEHFAPGVDVEIGVGPYKPMATQGNVDGFAPLVEPHHIEHAIDTFMNDLPGHEARTHAWAARFSKLWAWKNVLKPLIKVVTPLAKKQKRVIRLGDSIGLRT